VTLSIEPLDRRLSNGLRVVAHSDHTTPVVAVNVWYGVGSRHEQPSRTGFAHLFEHLMFQGSRQVPGSGHFSLLQGVGASLNGTTSFDRTNYFETVPKHALDLALWLEADRMGSLLEAVTQENLDNQRDVVKNERRQRYDNVPYGTAYERLFAGLFPEGHPYHHLPIGSMADLDAASLADVHAFFTTWYAPDNAVLSIVGDVDAEAAVDLAETYFGGIPGRGEFPAPGDGTIAPLAAPVRDDVDDPGVPNQALYIAFRVPADGTPQCDAADLALSVLAGGDSSRLVSRLVRREQVAQFAHGGVQRLVGGSAVGLLLLHAMPSADVARVEAMVNEELEAFAADGPTESEVERVRAQAERQFLDETGTAERLADDLARYTTLFGDPRALNDALERLLTTDRDAVHRAASELLLPQQAYVLTYRPVADAGGAGAEAGSPSGDDTEGSAA
jgi:predicted Zn-dependent peptidase